MMKGKNKKHRCSWARFGQLSLSGQEAEDLCGSVFGAANTNKLKR